MVHIITSKITITLGHITTDFVLSPGLTDKINETWNITPLLITASSRNNNNNMIWNILPGFPILIASTFFF